MIDLSALGLSSVHTQHAGGKRDKSSHDDGKNAKNFGDFVNAAGKNNRRNAANDDAANLKAADADTVEAATAGDEAAPPEAGEAELPGDRRTDIRTQADKSAAAPKFEKFADLGKAGNADAKQGKPPETHLPQAEAGKKAEDGKKADDGKKAEDGKADTSPALKAADGQKTAGALKVAELLRNVDAPGRAGTDNEVDGSHATTQAAPAEGRIQLPASVQQAMKSVADGGVLQRAEPAKSEVKTDRLEVKQEQNPHKDDVTAVKLKTAPSPSQELHALLGMAPEAEEADAEAVDPATEKPLAKASKHPDDDDKTADGKPAKTDDTVNAVIDAIKPDVPAAQAAAVQHAAVKAADSAPLAADADDGKTPAGNDAGKVQLLSDDGRSRPVDIELTRTGKDDDAEPQLNGKADFVTVLDSRRYLGFSTDAGNAAALTSAIKAEPSWAQVMQGVNAGVRHTATEVNTLKLQMNPEHLGNMTASLRLKGEELSVEVRVDTVDAYRQLSNDHDGIVKALKDQGFSIDQVSIQLSPSARADAGQGSTSQNSGNQSQSGGSGQNLQQGGQGDNARQRDESARRNLNQNNWMGNDPTSTFSDSGIGSGSADTGNLYL